MKFGLILPIQSLEVPLDKLIDELIEEAIAAEAAGFDACFLPEFHQAHLGAIVSPHLIGAAILRATTTLRFGAAVLATPLHHPIRLAEEILMLDWMSRGRIITGLGIGHQVPDFEAFSVNRAARSDITDEILDILDHAFSGDKFEYRGKHFSLAAHITPSPYSQPRPPVWIGAHSERGLTRAAQRADMWISDPQRDIDSCARLARFYKEQCAIANKVPHIGLFREAWIGDSKSDCIKNWGKHALAIHRLYYTVGTYRKEFEPWVNEVKNREDFTFERISAGRFLFGSGNEIVDEVRNWQAISGCEYLALRMRHPGGPTHLETMEAIGRFGAEVISKV